MSKKPVEKPQAWSRRPQFEPRQLLTADQLNAMNSDELNRQRLTNKALHGFGVVYGFGVTADAAGNVKMVDGCVEVSAGLGFDRHGRMLYWPGGPIGVDDTVTPDPEHEGRYTLRVHYAERQHPPKMYDPCDKDQPTWLDQGVVFSLTPGWDAVDRDCPTHPHSDCISHEDYLCQRTGAISGSEQIYLPPADDVQTISDEPGLLMKASSSDWCFDPDVDVSIPLMALDVCDRTKQSDSDYDPECDPVWGFCDTRPEICNVRPYVYRSPLLYELLNCCDVEQARINTVSWNHWTTDWSTAVPWDDFADRVHSREDVDSGFSVQFTKPVKIDTIHPSSIFVNIVYQESRTDYWMRQEIPMAELRVHEVFEGHGSVVQLIPDHDWIEAEVTGRQSTLKHGFRFELTVRGQLLRDECGHMVDARPVDVDPHTKCQDRPGGDFLSVFQVAAQDHHHDYYEPDPSTYVPESESETVTPSDGDAPSTSSEASVKPDESDKTK